MRMDMMEFLTSDPVIFFFSAIGLAATGWSIVRDARAQRARVTSEELIELELPRAA